MAKLTLFMGFLLSSLLSRAQTIEPTRLLVATYQPQFLEEAQETLIATNLIGTKSPVTYQAGQAVVLLPGFEAKAGSVFTARTGVASGAGGGEGGLRSLSLGVYPNPFAELTTISYQLSKPSRVSVQIRDIGGRLVSQLVTGQYQEAGRHRVEWVGTDAPAGTYVCILEAGTQRLSRRLIRK